jgi:membrane dipeptidase
MPNRPAPLRHDVRPACSGLRRRTLLLAALPALAFGPSFAARADAPVPISDMHSHYGILQRTSLPSASFAADLRAQHVALIAWSMPSDLRWIHEVETGVAQWREPAPGELPAFFKDRLGKLRAYVGRSGLRLVLAQADVDACVAGESGVVLASEGADYLEGRVEDLGMFYDLGLRHVQLVHYIRNPIGDFQTEPPVHNGLSDAGKQLVEACNEKGMLVDLAHCSAAAVDQALAITKRPVIWSHSWVDKTEGRWQDGIGYLQRRLSVEQARRIADHGGVVGLWGLGLARPGPSRTPGEGNWTVGRGDTRGYARELANLVNWIGAEHVGIGTDMEGVGAGWSVNSYDHVRSVIETLQGMKLPSGVIEQVAYLNYARVLKAALRG